MYAVAAGVRFAGYSPVVPWHMDNPLWDFSLKTYALEEVAPLCIRLQDEYNLDVNQLLYAAWLAQSGSGLTLEHLSALEAVVVDWRANVIRPLRSLRRNLKGYGPAAHVAVALQSMEFSAEQQQQQIMYVFHQQAPVLPSIASPLLENLLLVARLAGGAEPGSTSVVRQLAARIPA